MGAGLPTVVIGEKINPTGRKSFRLALLAGDWTMVKEDALAQMAAGADVLDVNVGAAGVNEVKVLPEVVKLVSEVVDAPLCIDSSSPEALAAAARASGAFIDGAVARGVPTAPWAIYRRGAPIDPAKCPAGSRYVVKPNNSSASWGVMDATDWPSVEKAIHGVHELGHDALVEPFIDGSDVEVPVVTINGEPVILPMMIFRQADPSHLRTYQEKRDLVDRSQKYSLDPFENPGMIAKITEYTRAAMQEYRPFDYGRWEFRVNEETGEMTFLELNLNCNLWSQKVFGRAAALAGWTHPELIETLLAESLSRHGLLR